MPPAKEYRTAKSDIVRSKGVPKVEAFPDLTFPKLVRGKLKNGIEVILAERHAIPVVQVQILFDAGYASDQGRGPGTSAFTMAMLDEGTKTLDSLEIARREERLGAQIGAGSGLDTSSVNLSALSSKLEPSLALFADIVRNPAFRDDDLARIRGQWLARIAQEKTQPRGIALRTLPPLLYGEGHAYAIPFTGSGNEAAINALTAKDLRAYLADRLRPDNAKILVAGDTTLEAIIPELDAVFGDWKSPKGTIAKKNIGTVEVPAKPRVYLVDKPGAQQSLILAGVLAPSTKAKNDLEIQTMNSAFGGTFTSRLNMNLREDKHWAYGAFSFLVGAIGQRPFMLYAPVQTDKTAESAAELLRESKDLIGPKPLTAEEIEKIKVGDVRSMPGEYQTTGSVLSAMTGIVTYDRPDDYVQTLKPRIEAQTDAAVQAAANEIVKPDAFTWVIVGDLRKIEKPVRDLGLGEVKVLNAEGKVVR
jgi:predicted Zn-dependent peptidase